ncbi:hypothetical protein ACFL1M_00765 [Patescibacteria group bacterium]
MKQQKPIDTIAPRNTSLNKEPEVVITEKVIEQPKIKSPKKGGKKKLFIIAILLAVLVSTYSLYLNFGVNNAEEDEYSQASSQVSFRIYKPEYLPENTVLIQEYVLTNTFNGKPVGDNNSVKVLIDYDAKTRTEMGSGIPIVLEQMKAPENTSVQNLQSILGQKDSLKPFRVGNSEIFKAYFLQKPLEDSELIVLAAITTDDTLVSILTTKAPLSEVSQIIENIK